MKLSILICHVPNNAGRQISLSNLCDTLAKQMYNGGMFGQVEVIVNPNAGTIGAKRNELLGWARGEYLCFVDDDDTVTSDYLSKTMVALESDPDCCSLTGIITWNGKNPELFEHTIDYNEYKTNDHDNPKYERYPNHINVIRASIAKQFKFPDKDFGEDTEWATQIRDSGLLKKEAKIKGVIYNYLYKTEK